MLGLAEQFGEGCAVLSVDDPTFEAGLLTAMDMAWNGADAARPKLLTAACRQIERSEHAYHRFVAAATERKDYVRRFGSWGG
jgi:hypothetical protein